jgi:hypothetical protein
MRLITRERVCLTWALVSAGLAGYGACSLSATVQWDIFGTPRTLDSLSPAIGIGVLIATLGVMITGIDAIFRERNRKAIEKMGREQFERGELDHLRQPSQEDHSARSPS